ncbi:deoxyribodipyrimidine photo-lyase [Idiomarina sp. Sol25]|uniref:deoxyribodipyrimidine photo-lyase n=1 Tax=Idiomarina sp. Sol25 TaxID=3064000 RepID=UPI00294B06A1|nr:deoxyribodipyrimidine photo-lyase [Idiomarina sp. Sol25]MDV6328175.1 deoxyribodipyrimidine photo-lyase [Idiomarina sp. Sol25]
MSRTAVVWLKRDLRLSDHDALAAALKHHDSVLLWYNFEPMLLDDPHYDMRHWRFVWQSLCDMNEQLKPYGVNLHISCGDTLEQLQRIQNKLGSIELYSYQEIGLINTYQRDKQVSRFCREQKINWHESSYGAVIRAARSRTGWRKNWNRVMRLESETLDLTRIIASPFELYRAPAEWQAYDPLFQKGGEQEARRTLLSFFEGRGKLYGVNISKPGLSRESCSRLSAHLAWGNLSLRQVYQYCLTYWQTPGWRKPLRALISRLHWHCHFIQKFESKISQQLKPINRGYETLPFRKDESVAQHLEAWKQGRTGYPLVDACMRCLIKTGYINFRMRAMLVSFLCHYLAIDWRLGADYLASLFLDFEPGIHYPQFQMQAGVTGINTVRIYNPTKQALEQDAEGTFIRTWLPELAELPNELLIEPWQLTPLESAMFDIELGTDYPYPIVDKDEYRGTMSKNLWDWRKSSLVQLENKRILSRHVDRSG